MGAVYSTTEIGGVRYDTKRGNFARSGGERFLRKAIRLGAHALEAAGVIAAFVLIPEVTVPVALFGIVSLAIGHTIGHITGRKDNIPPKVEGALNTTATWANTCAGTWLAGLAGAAAGILAPVAYYLEQGVQSVSNNVAPTAERTLVRPADTGRIAKALGAGWKDVSATTA